MVKYFHINFLSVDWLILSMLEKEMWCIKLTHCLYYADQADSFVMSLLMKGQNLLYSRYVSPPPPPPPPPPFIHTTTCIGWSMYNLSAVHNLSIIYLFKAVTHLHIIARCHTLYAVLVYMFIDKSDILQYTADPINTYDAWPFKFRHLKWRFWDGVPMNHKN